MTIKLPDDLEQFVLDQVASGTFETPEDVIRHALLTSATASEHTGDSPAMTEEQFDRFLLRTGRISRIPRAESVDYGDDPGPIAVEGEPLSATIIRERRS